MSCKWLQREPLDSIPLLLYFWVWSMSVDGASSGTSQQGHCLLQICPEWLLGKAVFLTHANKSPYSILEESSLVILYCCHMMVSFHWWIVLPFLWTYASRWEGFISGLWCKRAFKPYTFPPGLVIFVTLDLCWAVFTCRLWTPYTDYFSSTWHIDWFSHLYTPP